MRALLAIALVAGLAHSAIAAEGDAKVTPGEFVIEHPTLINLGFEWHIDGDANRNASVDVSYRKQGETAWRTGMPLVRLHGEQVFQRNVFNLVTPNMFAGSILDLEPGTAYEARFVMTDPDGVSGPAANATKTVTVRTRPEPMPAAGGKTYHVYPTKWQGPKIEPAFEGIMCAYNYWCGAGDTAPGGRPRVKPGDTILVHAGTYAYHYEFYGNQTTVNATTTFEGTYYLTGKGTPEKPIVIKAAGDGEVILDGRGNFNLFNVKAADYNYFEGITFRNTKIAIWAGTQFIAGSKGLTVKRCRFEDVGMGVFTNYSGSSDFYIADSVFIGRNDPKHLIGWTGPFWQQFEHVEGQEYPPVMKSYTGIRLYGPGHVVAHNYVANFHDGIDTEMYGMPDGSHPIDGPELSAARVLGSPADRDRHLQQLHHQRARQLDRDGRQHAQHPRDAEHADQLGVASDEHAAVGRRADLLHPQHRLSRAGRLDAADRRIARRVLLQQHHPHRDRRRGVGSNVHWRNNLMLRAERAGRRSSPSTPTPTTARRTTTASVPNPGNEAFQWNSPPSGVATIPADGSGGAKIETRKFATLEAYAQATKQDQHSVLVDYDIFVNVTKLDAKDLATVQRLYKAEDFDFRLKPGSAAVDRGVALPNVTDGFTGQAPDLGALEVGRPVPVYGPRPR